MSYLLLTLRGILKGYTNGYEFRQSQEVREALKHFDKSEFYRFYQDGKLCNFRVPVSACEIKNNGKKLLLVGDSYLGTFTNIMSEQKNINKNFIIFEEAYFIDTLNSDMKIPNTRLKKNYGGIRDEY